MTTTAATGQPINPQSIARQLIGELNADLESRALLSEILASEEFRRDRDRQDILESTVRQLIDLLREILDSLPTAMVNALAPVATAVDNLQTDVTSVGRIQQTIVPQLESLHASQQTIVPQLESLLIFQQTIQAEIDAIRDTLRTAQATIGNLDNSVAEIKGWGLELLSSRRISRYADTLNMTGLREVPQSEIRSVAEDAARRNNITPDEMRQVSNADAYFYGHSSILQNSAYLVVQISYTVNSNDVSRAIDQSVILNKITGDAAIPVVAGTYLRPDAAAAINGPIRVYYVPMGNGNSLRA